MYHCFAAILTVFLILNSLPVKEVRSNKDASEGRDEDRIAVGDKPDLMQAAFKCRFLQFVGWLFVGYLLFSSYGTNTNPYLGVFSHFH